MVNVVRDLEGERVANLRLDCRKLVEVLDCFGEVDETRAPRNNVEIVIGRLDDGGFVRLELLRPWELQLGLSGRVGCDARLRGELLENF